MMDAETKLAMIRDICRHPGSWAWTGRQMAEAINRVITGNQPIPYTLSELDHPIPYEVVHDAVYEEMDDDQRA